MTRRCAMTILVKPDGVPVFPSPTSEQMTYMGIALSVLAVRLRFDRYIRRQDVFSIKRSARLDVLGATRSLMREVLAPYSSESRTHSY